MEPEEEAAEEDEASSLGTSRQNSTADFGALEDEAAAGCVGSSLLSCPAAIRARLSIALRPLVGVAPGCGTRGQSALSGPPQRGWQQSSAAAHAVRAGTGSGRTSSLCTGDVCRRRLLGAEQP